MMRLSSLGPIVRRLTQRRVLVLGLVSCGCKVNDELDGAKNLLNFSSYFRPGDGTVKFRGTVWPVSSAPDERRLSRRCLFPFSFLAILILCVEGTFVKRYSVLFP